MSDDESSDSSNDFLVDPNQLDHESLFLQATTSRKKESSSEMSAHSSDDDFIYDDSKNIESAKILNQVMQNLMKNNEEHPTNSREVDLHLESLKSRKTPIKLGGRLSNEINDLLLKGESNLGSSSSTLEEEGSPEVPNDYSIPSEGVNITLPGTEMIFNRRKKRKDVNLQAELIKKMNRRLRSCQLFIHKVGLLCWLSHGFHLNRCVNNPEVLAIAMSLIPEKSYPKGRIDLKYLEHFTEWFRNVVKVEFNPENVAITEEILIKRFENKAVHNLRELVLLYICMLRAMGLNCRLVVSLYPPPLKPHHDQCFQLPSNTKDDENNKKEENKKPKSKKKAEDQKKKGKLITNKNGNFIPGNSREADDKNMNDAKERAVGLLRSKYFKEDKKKMSRKDEVKQSENSEKVDESESPPVKKLRFRTIKMKKEDPKVKEESAINREETNVRELRGRIIKKIKSEPSTSKIENDKNDSEHDEEDSDEDSDFEKPTKPKKKEGMKKRNSIDRRILSTDDENDTKDGKKTAKNLEESENIEPRDGHYLWAEIYVDGVGSWISANVLANKIHSDSELYKKAPSPMLYVIAWSSTGQVKDVTRRYCPHWLTVTRKRRVEEKWWEESLSAWKEQPTGLSKDEDEMLLQKEMEQPLPKTLSECKGHPLYALARHLLKFEALYPPDCVPLGHLKNGDAIYSRHCVHTLRSRETWLKQARVVKPAQEPYKIVKAMPKYDKLSGTVVKDLPLELFGKWQTDPYLPPEAKDGIVPRNEYGNVDLFQQCMLPKGTVHIDLPSLARVAKKLNIDCVAAVVGFNFGGRGAMPMTQGYVVCEEFEDTLREAWENEQVQAAKRAREKRDKRIWGNWKKLIRGLMIKERIMNRYLTSTDDDVEEKKEPPKRKKETNRPTKKKKI